MSITTGQRVMSIALTRVIAFLTTLALVVGVGGVPSARAAGGYTLADGHTDIFYAIAGDVGLGLALKEDVSGHNVLHFPEDVILAVGEDAYSEDVADVPEIGQPGYYLPQTQQRGILWPGWSTEQVASAGIDAIDFNFESVSGPGDVYLFSQLGLGELAPVLADGSFVLGSGSVLSQPHPAHVHANWVFTEPGTYEMTVSAHGGGRSSEPRTYVWEVGGNPGTSIADDGLTPGDFLDGDVAADLPEGSPAEGETEGGAESAGSASGGSTGERGEDTAAKKTGGSGKSGKSGKSGASGASGKSGAASGDKLCQGLVPLIKDDRQQPPRWVRPGTLSFGLGEEAKRTLPEALGPVSPGEVWMIAATQEDEVPWVGANTQHPSIREEIDGEVTWELTGFNGPGEMFVYEQGNLGKVVGKEWFRGQGAAGEGRVDLPENSHVHPNWVFSQPGTYRVSITQSATTKGGKDVSGTGTITFHVGEPAKGDATEGHFDIGAERSDEECSAADMGAEGGSDDTVNVAGARSTTSAGTVPTGVTWQSIMIAVLGIIIAAVGVVCYRNTIKDRP